MFMIRTTTRPIGLMALGAAIATIRRTAESAALRMILTPHHEVRLARSGSRALEILGTEPVDVVTLDLNMPGISGLDILRVLKAERPNLPVLILSGDVFANRRPDPVLQQVEHFGNPTI